MFRQPPGLVASALAEETDALWTTPCTARTTRVTNLTWVVPLFPANREAAVLRELLRPFHAPHRPTEGGSGGATVTERTEV